MKQLILFDIDGTLADISHRRPYLDRQPPDWKSFNLAMGEDSPNAPVVALYKTLWDSGLYELFIVTGRTEDQRRHTEQWLVWNDIPFQKLLMRCVDDFRADHLIKEEILNKLRQDGRDILFVVDDRQQVVDMWRRHGVTCLQCATGDF